MQRNFVVTHLRNSRMPQPRPPSTSHFQQQSVHIHTLTLLPWQLQTTNIPSNIHLVSMKPFQTNNLCKPPNTAATTQGMDTHTHAIYTPGVLECPWAYIPVQVVNYIHEVVFHVKAQVFAGNCSYSSVSVHYMCVAEHCIISPCKHTGLCVTAAVMTTNKKKTICICLCVCISVCLWCACMQPM